MLARQRQEVILEETRRGHTVADVGLAAAHTALDAAESEGSEFARTIT